MREIFKRNGRCARTIDAFGEDSIAKMVRRESPPTSVEAARVVRRNLGELHKRVIEAFREFGPMTDEQVEKLPRFADCAPSTIRKRRSELADPSNFDPPRIVKIGVQQRAGKSPISIWKLAPTELHS